MNIEFSDIELEVLIDLLDNSSEIFSNFSCNDYTLANNKERLEFIKIVDEDWEDDFGEDYEETDEKIYTSDVVLMDYFIAKLDKFKELTNEWEISN